MEKILSALNGLSETWLTLGSASYHIDLNYTLLSGLGLLLLYISYLILKLLIHLLGRKKYTPKRQNSIRRKQRKAFKPQTSHMIPRAFGKRYAQIPVVAYVTKQALRSDTCSLRLPWKMVLPRCPLCHLPLP
uniref:Spermatogenesis associated 31 subfamily D, member 1A n=1 Tax=Mus musculus TaxID=10090 RepID=A0A286YCE9_MOUSE